MRTSIKTRLLTTSIIIAAASTANAATPVIEHLGGGVTLAPQTATSTTLTQTGATATNIFKTIDTVAGESLNLILPNAKAVSIEKVDSGIATNFAGILNAEYKNANGKLVTGGNVIIENNAGLTFVPGSQINVSGLVATTANSVTQNKDGSYHFDGFSDAKVDFQGKVTAVGSDGYIIALAKNISTEEVSPFNSYDYNAGLIASGNNSNVTLAAGSKSYDVTMQGNPNITYSVDNLDSSSISVLGQVTTYGNFVIKAKANDIYSSVINLKGSVYADQSLTVTGDGDVNAGNFASGNVSVTAGKDLTILDGGIASFNNLRAGPGDKITLVANGSITAKGNMGFEDELDAGTINITSGGDTTLSQYSVSADKFTAKTGGDFNFDGKFASNSSLNMGAASIYDRTSFAVNATGDVNINKNLSTGAISAGTVDIQGKNVDLNGRINVIINEGIESDGYNPITGSYPIGFDGYAKVVATGSLHSNARVQTFQLSSQEDTQARSSLHSYNPIPVAGYYSSISMKAGGAFTNDVNAKYVTAQSGGVNYTYGFQQNMSGNVALSGGLGSNLDAKDSKGKLMINSQINATGTAGAASGAVAVKEMEDDDTVKRLR